MGITKTEVFTASQNHLATLTKALGHPARIAIIEALIQQKSCTCGEFVSLIPLSQPTISQHLKELKAIGLIAGEISGSSIYYRINKPFWEASGELLLNLFTAPLD